MSIARSGATASIQRPSSVSVCRAESRMPTAWGNGMAVRKSLTDPRAGSTQSSRTRPVGSTNSRGASSVEIGGCGRADTTTPGA